MKLSDVPVNGLFRFFEGGDLYVKQCESTYHWFKINSCFGLWQVVGCCNYVITEDEMNIDVYYECHRSDFMPENNQGVCLLEVMKWPQDI